MQNKKVIIKIECITEEWKKDELLEKLYEFLKTIKVDYVEIMED